MCNTNGKKEEGKKGKEGITGNVGRMARPVGYKGSVLPVTCTRHLIMKVFCEMNPKNRTKKTFRVHFKFLRTEDLQLSPSTKPNQPPDEYPQHSGRPSLSGTPV